MLISHALFKADAVPGRRHRRPLHRHPGPAPAVRRSAGALPVVAVAAAVAAASMAAIPPLIGFTAKEAAFESLSLPARPTATAPASRRWPPVLLAAALVAGSALTVAYTLRFFWGAFATKRSDVSDEPETEVLPIAPGFAVAPGPAGRAEPGRRLRRSPADRPRSPRTSDRRVGRRGEPRDRVVARLLACRWPMSVLALVGRCAACSGSAAGSPGSSPPSRRTREAEEVYQAHDAGRRPAGGRGHRAAPSAARCRSISARSCSWWSACPAACCCSPPSGPAGTVLFDTPAQLLVGVMIVAAAFLAATSRGRLQGGRCWSGSPATARRCCSCCTAPRTSPSPRSWSRRSPWWSSCWCCASCPSTSPTGRCTLSRWWRLVIAVAGRLTVVGARVSSPPAPGSRVPVSEAFYEAAYTFGYGQQHRQRHPGRHPGLGHDGRDLGAGGRRHRRGQPDLHPPPLHR